MSGFEVSGKKRIVVAGGSGFIGHQLLETTHEAGHHVINIDLRPPVSSISEIETIDGIDLSRPDSTDNAFNIAEQKLGGKIDAVFNMVAIVSYTKSDRELAGPNVISAKNIAYQAARRKAFIIHMSGTAIHGHVNHAIRETDSVNPVEAYGRSKKAAEKEVFEEISKRNSRALIFRSTAPVGPGLDTAGINGLYRMIMDQPFILATRGSNVTYISTEDIARAFVFAVENERKVLPESRDKLSDIAFNLGVEEPFSDRQAGEYLVESILGKGKKPVIDVPYWLVLASSYPIQWANSLRNLLRERKQEPDLAINLAKLMKGPHFQDPAKFNHYFSNNGFKFKHPTPGEALDTGVVYKFETEWMDKEPTERIKVLMKRN